MRRRENGQGRGKIVEDAVLHTGWAQKLGTPAPSLDHLSADEVAFVQDVLADRAGFGSLVSLIEARFGPYPKEQAHV